MIMKKFKALGLAVSTVALLSIANPVTAQDAPTQLTLQDAVSKGVMTNPEYGAVAASRRATDEELRQAYALYFPSVDFRTDGGVEYTDDPVTRGNGPETDEELFRYDSSLTLTQMLFDGFETKFENERQKARVQSSAHRVRETSELVGLSIVEFFLEVMRQRELLNISRENVAAHIEILEQIQDGVTAGRTTQADLEQAKARLASARAGESSLRQQLRVAESNFKREVGDFPQDLVLPVIPVDALAANVDEEVKEAVTQSPTLDVFESDIDVAHAEKQGTGSTLYPELDLQLNARQGHELGGVEGRDRSASALLVMNWNLYRGGADVARIREFTHRHQQAKEERAEAARSIEDQVRQTWAQMVSAGEQAREFSAQAAANAEVVRAYKDQFELDRRTLLDVLDSQTELFVSRSNAINAEYLEIFSVYSLLAFKGELLPTLSVAYPRESATIDKG